MLIFLFLRDKESFLGNKHQETNQSRNFLEGTWQQHVFNDLQEDHMLQAIRGFGRK